MKPDLLRLFPEELEKILVELGQPAYRANQLFEWLHAKRAGDFGGMTSLPAPLREMLEKSYSIVSLNLKKRLVSSIDGTVKYLYELDGGGVVEGAAMEYSHGVSLCVSTQVGCRMGCAFCASGINGLNRNLTAGEILGEVYAAADDLAAHGKKLGGAVLMGTGEPLDNFDEVIRFLDLFSHPKGFGMSLRHLSLSTCGFADGIKKLAEKRYPLTLSVSLHAPDDDTRSSLMPVNKKYNIAALLSACRDYIKKTGRRVSFEYSLINGINDDIKRAEALAALLGGMNCHVNLIPHNPVEGKPFARSTPEKVKQFKQTLKRRGINVTVRRELGADVMAACGQLVVRN
jgi:23S rRNA (adenine2503-C2)-methyltransferase